MVGKKERKKTKTLSAEVIELDAAEGQSGQGPEWPSAKTEATLSNRGSRALMQPLTRAAQRQRPDYAQQASAMSWSKTMAETKQRLNSYNNKKCRGAASDNQSSNQSNNQPADVNVMQTNE
jgi:hypothetical protein